MAFNWPVFKTRAQTAVIFVVVMAAGLLTSHWLFLLLFLIIHWGCWIEYQSLMGRIHPEYREISPFHRNGVILTGIGLMLFATSDTWKLGNISLSALGFWLALIMAFVLPVTELLFSSNINLKNIWTSLKGLVYISVSLALMVNLRTGEIWRIHDENNLLYELSQTTSRYTGFIMPLLVIGSIWVNDTMAYIVGSLIGKTPLSKISPKKTWEGTIGGIILSVTVLSLIGHVAGASWVHYLSISLIASVAGTFGDLFESKLKRMAGVKDSGSFMPGHGGFLDRFDSLLFAVPFVWLYALAFM